jgi:hypothetical protein
MQPNVSARGDAPANRRAANALTRFFVRAIADRRTHFADRARRIMQRKSR